MPKDSLPCEKNSAVLDRNRVLHVVGGNIDLLRELVRLCRSTCCDSVAQIAEALAVGDYETIQLAAHRLKSSVSTFHAKAAFDAAGRLEDKGRQRDLDAAKTEYHQVQREIARLNPALDSLVEMEHLHQD